MKFKDGEVIPADLVVMAAGIRPNTELAESAGIACNRGILVNDTCLLYTSDRIVMMTNGPAATVGEILAVELPRPRDRLALANDPQYHAYRTAVLEFLYQRQQRPAA